MFAVLFTWATDETAFAIWMNFLNKALGQQFLQYFFIPQMKTVKANYWK